MLSQMRRTSLGVGNSTGQGEAPHLPAVLILSRHGSRVNQPHVHVTAADASDLHRACDYKPDPTLLTGARRFLDLP